MLDVVGEVDGGHPAGVQLPFYRIVSGQGCAKTIEKNQSSLCSCVAKGGSAVVTDDWAELVANKRTAARLKDLADIEALGESP